MGSRPSARGSLSGQQESVRKGSAPDRTRTMHKLGEDRLMEGGARMRSRLSQERRRVFHSQVRQGLVRSGSGQGDAHD